MKFESIKHLQTEVIRLYTEENKGILPIAKLIGLGKRDIRYILINNKVPIKSRGERGLTEEQQELIIDLYVEKKLSLKETAKQANTTTKKVFSFLHKQDLPEETFNRVSTYKTLNENFFDPKNIDKNPIAQYWFGMLLGDGSLRNEPDYVVSLGLTVTDIEHLRKYARCFESDYEPSIRKDGLVARIEIKRKKVYENVYELGKRKDNLSEVTCDITKHLLRGLVDSDGHLCKYKKVKDRYHLIEFLGGAYLLDQVRTQLYLDLDVSMNSIVKLKRYETGNLHSLRYSGKTALKIAQYLYEDAPYIARLDRKYEIYQKYFVPFIEDH